MYRTTLVLLLFAVKLPMTAGEASGVTVHQAEWGDTRGEAPPPSGPSIPIKADVSSPVFERRGFRYGEGLQYGNRIRYGQSIPYNPGTRVRHGRANTRNYYQPNITYQGAGKRMDSAYQPDIVYAPGIDRQRGPRYGFSR